MSRLLADIVTLILLCPSVLLAQSDTATISGRITDQTDQVLVGAQVNVANVETGVEASTLTNTEGIYVVGDLRAGPYRMLVEKEGFHTVVLTDLILNVQDSLGRNLTMLIGPRNESITITARGEDNLSPAVSTIVDQQSSKICRSMGAASSRSFNCPPVSWLQRRVRPRKASSASTGSAATPTTSPSTA